MSPGILTALPVFNEADHVKSVLEQVRWYSSDIVVVDDGSTDATPEILARERDIRLICHEQNLGYGAALRTAFQYALEEDYDVLVTIDCDGQHQPPLVPKLASQLIAHGESATRASWDMVSGSRYLKAFAGDTSPPEDRRRINARITGLLNEHLGLALTDAFCGFKAYRVPALAGLHITDTGYAMPLQLWVQAVRLGWRIVEFPVPLVYLEEERSFGGALDESDERMAYYMEVLNRELTSPQVSQEVCHQGISGIVWMEPARGMPLG